MITIKKIDTIEGVKDLIFEQTYNAAIDRTRSSYFYRGRQLLILLQIGKLENG